MARPQNKELKEQIQKTAWKQFRVRGYNGTSYASIAEECGVSRNLVQYHIPKKELLAIAFMDDMLSRCQEALGYGQNDIFGNYQRIFEIGCLFFQSLLAGGYQQFLLDILQSREFTEDILAFDADWGLSHIGAELPQGKHREETLHTIIKQMGGFYELLYYCLRNSKEIDIAKQLAEVMRAWAIAMGVSPEKAAHMFRSSKRVREASVVFP